MIVDLFDLTYAVGVEEEESGGKAVGLYKNTSSYRDPPRRRMDLAHALVQSCLLSESVPLLSPFAPHSTACTGPRTLHIRPGLGSCALPAVFHTGHGSLLRQYLPPYLRLHPGLVCMLQRQMPSDGLFLSSGVCVGFVRRRPFMSYIASVIHSTIIACFVCRLLLFWDRVFLTLLRKLL